MYFSTHIICGAAVGSLTQAPSWGLAAGVASHIALDMIPHYEHQRRLVAIGEVLFGLGLLTAMWQLKPNSPLWWGAFGGALPDIEIALYELSWLATKRFPSHSGRLRHGQTGLPYGLVSQMLVSIVSLWILWSKMEYF